MNNARPAPSNGLIMMKCLIAAALLTLTLSGCGFRPIYATPADGAAPLNQRVAVRQVAAPETIAPLITTALNDRIVLREGESPRYDLLVQASERAERLAVQIDATVTRFNYRLQARYTLVDRETGRRVNGNAQALTSYNIVTSQYSTLFAERTAQEKAARLLAEEIERDLLIRFSSLADEAEAAAEAEADPNAGVFPLDIDPETNLLIEREEQTVFAPYEEE